MNLALAPQRFSASQIAAAKAAGSIVAVAERGGIQMDLRKSRPSKGDYWALCPFHAERTPSLHIVERGGQGWFKCHGCGEAGDGIALAQRLFACGFPEALRILGGDVEVEPSAELLEHIAQRRREREAESERERVVRRAAAVAIWEAAEPIAGTPAAHYLRHARKITAPLGGAELRFHPRAPLSPYDPPKAGRCAAMLAAIRYAEGEHIGTHATFIKSDGSAKATLAHLPGSRLICGDHVGGFIRLGHVRDSAVAGEGIETTLSASEACSLPGLAAINAPNLAALILPKKIRRVVIAHDVDPKGKDGKRGEAGQLAGLALAERLWAVGLQVEMLPPPEGFNDWNAAAQATPMARAAA